MKMSNQPFADSEELLLHLLDELEHRPEILTRTMSGQHLNMVTVLRAFHTEVPYPHGRAHFLCYLVIFLYNDWPVNAVWSCSNLNEYDTAWNRLRNYRNMLCKTKVKVLKCLARLGEHFILKCIYPMMMRQGSAPPSSEATQTRLAELRQQCLRRDGNRCVVTGAFNLSETVVRQQQEDLNDDGRPLRANPHGFRSLEVAHIIPHALGWRNDADQNSILPRLNVHIILDMFCPGTMGRYAGSAIDHPGNAISMDFESHWLFGNLDIYFEPIQGSQTNYTVHHVREPFYPLPQLPKSITFRTITNVNLPDQGLLAIHRACARIAHVTGAAETAVRFFRDLEDGTVEADGSTPLGNLVTHRLQFDHHSTASQWEHRSFGQCIG